LRQLLLWYGAPAISFVRRSDPQLPRNIERIRHHWREGPLKNRHNNRATHRTSCARGQATVSCPARSRGRRLISCASVAGLDFDGVTKRSMLTKFDTDARILRKNGRRFRNRQERPAP
jgi:hypothetical protein